MSNPTAMADRRVLIAALVLGAIAAGLAVAFLASADNGGTSSAATSETTRAVVVATTDINVGDRITGEMLEVRELPAIAVIDGAAAELDQVVGETARYPIAPGEQLNAARLVEPPQVQSLSFQIPDGMRGFTIPVNASESPAALLAPGDFVDVLVAGDAATLVSTGNVLYEDDLLVAERRDPFATSNDTLLDLDNTRIAEQAVTTLLQNIQVLSVEREYVENGVPYDASVRGAPPEDGRVTYVTVALAPEDAQLLWLATQEGDVTLTLRAFGDDEVGPIGAAGRNVRNQQ